MSQSALSSLFLGVRAKKGDAIASQFLDDMSDKQLVETLDLEIESLSMSLQMQYSRTQGSNLMQIRSRQIGTQIKDIIEAGVNDLVTQLSKKPQKLLPIFHLIFENAHNGMTKSAQETYQFVQSLNLSHDFSKIIFQIQSFPYSDIIQTLKCLVIASVIRRYKRRQFLPN